LRFFFKILEEFSLKGKKGGGGSKKIKKFRVNSQVEKTDFSKFYCQPSQGNVKVKAVEEKGDEEIAFHWLFGLTQ